MSDTKTKNIIELSTNCSCQIYDENDELKEADFCYGYCWQDVLDELSFAIEKWTEINGYTDSTIIRVQAEAIGWMRQSGYKDVFPQDISKCLNLDSDFTIYYTFSEDYKTLTAQRYSHDEPVGTGRITFTESPFSQCDFCGGLAECKKLNEESICEYCGTE